LHAAETLEALMTRFHHVLVPVDFEDPSHETLEVAIALALTFDARLTVLHAWDLPVYSYAGLSYLPPDVATVVEEAAEKSLTSAMALATSRVPKAESVLVRGPAAVEILEAAGRLKADLIVMGTHGRRGVSRMLLGSVAEKVVRSSLVPVLTIRMKPPSSV
jgi:nucleotide-binding universal stress UspA family protein